MQAQKVELPKILERLYEIIDNFDRATVVWII